MDLWMCKLLFVTMKNNFIPICLSAFVQLTRFFHSRHGKAIANAGVRSFAFILPLSIYTSWEM